MRIAELITLIAILVAFAIATGAVIYLITKAPLGVQLALGIGGCAYAWVTRK